MQVVDRPAIATVLEGCDVACDVEWIERRIGSDIERVVRVSVLLRAPRLCH